MRLTRKTIYGVTLLRALNEAEAKKLEAVAIDYNLSHDYLELIARCLRKAGIIRAVRGPGGRIRTEP